MTEAEISLDRSLNVYQTGSTTSSSYISTTGAFQTTYGGSRDILFAKFNNERLQIRRPAPRIGEHNIDIYQNALGISLRELEQLQAGGVI